MAEEEVVLLNNVPEEEKVMSKNARKKAKQKKSNKRQQWINALRERNASEIKCPKDLDDEGIIEVLDDIKLED